MAEDLKQLVLLFTPWFGWATCFRLLGFSFLLAVLSSLLDGYLSVKRDK